MIRTRATHQLRRATSPRVRLYFSSANGNSSAPLTHPSAGRFADRATDAKPKKKTGKKLEIKMKSKETKPAEVSTSSVPNFSREEIHAVVGMPHAQSMAVPAAPATAAPNLLGDDFMAPPAPAAAETPADFGAFSSAPPSNGNGGLGFADAFDPRATSSTAQLGVQPAAQPGMPGMAPVPPSGAAFGMPGAPGQMAFGMPPVPTQPMAPGEARTDHTRLSHS